MGGFVEESIGSYLKRQRNMRNISLEEVAQSTKIGLRTLTALEANDFSALPGFAFAKGFVHSYAQAIGINADEAMWHCESYLKVVLKQDPEKKQKVHWLRPNRWQLKPWVFVFLVALISVIVAYFRSR